MCVNHLPKVATQWNSGATRDSNRGRRVLIPSALTTRPPSRTNRSIVDGQWSTLVVSATVRLLELRKGRTLNLLRATLCNACPAVRYTAFIEARRTNIKRFPWNEPTIDYRPINIRLPRKRRARSRGTSIGTTHCKRMKKARRQNMNKKLSYRLETGRQRHAFRFITMLLLGIWLFHLAFYMLHFGLS